MTSYNIPVYLCLCVSSAPLKLQELLRNSNLPNEFLLPFDPRIKAGWILVSLLLPVGVMQILSEGSRAQKDVRGMNTFKHIQSDHI